MGIPQKKLKFLKDLQKILLECSVKMNFSKNLSHADQRLG